MCAGVECSLVRGCDEADGLWVWLESLATAGRSLFYLRTRASASS